jgi:ech hydrogenase subunit B
MILGYMVLAPLAGGLIAGFDRKVTARMQSRVGPPILQPFYDVLKLFEKQNLTVNRYHSYFIVCYLVFLLVSGSLFFAGEDILMVVFAFALADIFFVLAAYSTNSPYSSIGAERELLQMLASEPMLLLFGIGLFMATGSFQVSTIIASGKPVILYLPGFFLGLAFILTIRLRKSPFDLATSYHGHQELVKGITTEFAGPSLSLVEVAHWYESILLLGIMYLFFAFQPVIGVAVVVLVYAVEVAIDNTNARIKWELMLKSAWFVTLVLGVTNLFVLYFFVR